MPMTGSHAMNIDEAYIVVMREGTTERHAFTVECDRTYTAFREPS